MFPVFCEKIMFEVGCFPFFRPFGWGLKNQIRNSDFLIKRNKVNTSDAQWTVEILVDSIYS